MFTNFENSCTLPANNGVYYAQQSNQMADKSLQIIRSHSKESRQQKMARMRQLAHIEMLQYDKVNFNKFIPIVQRQQNPYTILVTIFAIVDNFQWRQYLGHLEILIKKFTNFIESSRGKILQEIINHEQNKQKLCGYNFQQRLETMLHLSNKQFQQHLLILIHALVAYNKKYGIVDEVMLSDHLTFKHSYQKCIRQDVLWLLTRMSISCEALNKVIKSYLQNHFITPVLPVLTIIANFIYEQPTHIVQDFILSQDFQKTLQKGLLSFNFESQRQSVFIFNNLLFKSKNCSDFVLSQVGLINQIRQLNNQEVAVFNVIISNSSNSQQNQHRENSISMN